MIISIPTQAGMINFCLNASMLKCIACVVSVLLLITGYATVQFATFILAASPQQFLRIVLFTVFSIGLVVVVRLLLAWKAGTK